MEDSERIDEALKIMSRNNKFTIVYGKQDLHSFVNQSRPEGLSDRESTGPKLRFVSISKNCARRIKGSRARREQRYI